MAEAHAQLREALEFLAAHGIQVLLSGDRYVVNGERMTFDDFIAFASTWTPPKSNEPR